MMSAAATLCELIHVCSVADICFLHLLHRDLLYDVCGCYVVRVEICSAADPYLVHLFL